MKNNKKYSNSKGITLIALLLTIVVMLILLGVVVDLAIDEDVVDVAEETVNKSNDKVAEHQSNVGEWVGILKEEEQERCIHIFNTNGVCTKCEKRCTHSYLNDICTICGRQRHELSASCGYTEECSNCSAYYGECNGEAMTSKVNVKCDSCSITVEATKSICKSCDYELISYYHESGITGGEHMAGMEDFSPHTCALCNGTGKVCDEHKTTGDHYYCETHNYVGTDKWCQ